MRVVELESVSDGDWREIIAGEPQPWGEVGEGLRWRAKSHNFGVRDDAGVLVAVAGLVLVEVRVSDAPLQVAGIGGVFVTRAARGGGLARLLIERVLRIAHELGPERAMLFCTSANIGLYTRFGFRPIEERVFVGQPAGVIEMPLRAMWKPLVDTADWPAGRVELPGEPF